MDMGEWLLFLPVWVSNAYMLRSLPTDVGDARHGGTTAFGLPADAGD